MSPGAQAEISGSTFVNNSAVNSICSGGAVSVDNGAIASITNSTFTGNHSDTYGGAVSVNAGANVTVTNITASGNSAAGPGAGFYVGGTLTVRNSIIAENQPNTNCAIGENGMIRDGGGNVRYPYFDQSCVGDFGNPYLGTLADNGGSTLTMAIGLGSAAIDKINGAGGCGAGIYADQRGVARPGYGLYCDAGAYEYQLSSDSYRCFISAVYGFSDNDQVKTLRSFRDQYLATSRLGRTMIDRYYEMSSKYAGLISQNEILCTAARMLLFPIYLLALSIINWPLALPLIILSFSALFFYRRHQASVRSIG